MFLLLPDVGQVRPAQHRVERAPAHDCPRVRHAFVVVAKVVVGRVVVVVVARVVLGLVVVVVGVVVVVVATVVVVVVVVVGVVGVVGIVIVVLVGIATVVLVAVVAVVGVVFWQSVGQEANDSLASHTELPQGVRLSVTVAIPVTVFNASSVIFKPDVVSVTDDPTVVSFARYSTKGKDNG